MIEPVDVTAALLVGPWSGEPMRLRATHAVGRLTVGPAVIELIDAVLARWPQRPASGELLAFIAQWPELGDEPQSPRPALAVEPAYPRLHQPLVPLATRADLARLLWLTDGELDWFADVQSRGRRRGPGPLQHYRYRAVASADRIRLLEIPKPRLKEIHRRLLGQLVRPIPLHPAAHGAVTGRSVASCLQPHAGRAVVVRCDLEGFFAAVTAARVRGLFAAIGMTPEAAAIAAGLCTTATPVQVRRELPVPTLRDAHRRMLSRLAVPHLPQGAPTSAGLANAIGYAMDYRLSALATALGASYTRYVDDLIFSGDDLAVGAVLAGVRDIVRAEGFQLAERKTAVLRSSQRQAVLGAVVNATPSIDRRELDRLKAVLHNCRRHGVASQTRGASVIEFRSVLQGQLAWVSSVNPAQGARLRAAFDSVDWSSAAS